QKGIFTMRSIKWKLVAMYMGLVLIVMLVSGTYIVLRLQSNEINKSRDELVLYAEKIRDQVVLGYEEINFESALEDFSKLDTSGLELSGSILDERGETIATTLAVSPPYPSYKNQLIISALSGTEGFSESIKETGSEPAQEVMGYALPVTVDEEVRYVIYTRMDAASFRESLSATRQTMAVAVVISIILSAAMGYIFARSLTGPIELLSRRAKELAEGAFKQKIPVCSADEIGDLTDSFNYMSSELSRNIGEISREKTKLEIILENMSDGIIAFDQDGNTTLWNSEAARMLELETIDFTFTGFIKDFDINAGVYFDLERENVRQSIFPVGERFVNASFSPYMGDRGTLDGVVVVLQDITEQRKLEEMRKEFVANVSHELRTPLTTVKSYTETLLSGAMEDKELAAEFLEIIDSEADRMAFLVRDLLQLSRFDNDQVKPRLGQVNLSDFLERAVKQSKILAQQKEQELILGEVPKDIYITADRDRINQVMNNVLSNAIKYSPEQARIEVGFEEDEKYYKVSVADNGLGIKKEDLARIFERFYRVDKARSRSMGGTGLGLAIAREIMELHRGRITADSQYGRGTTMTMWFLKNYYKEDYE
ncbi:MAG: HAMP domain-containing protein, partial [Firmicutes bacterium]|nr:HAMP domain-containing protein [Bacillota bacterium]